MHLLHSMQRGDSVYIMTNKLRTVLYTGVTSNLLARVQEHREHFYPKSFTSKYKCELLVYFECLGCIEEAISREKEIKKWRRDKKDELINAINPSWKDLWVEIYYDD